MKPILSLTLLALVFFTSCVDKEKEAQNNLFKDVMAVHDEIMPKMDDIMNFKKQLKQKVEDFSAVQPVDSAAISELQQAIADLDNSHDEMMGWMRQFNRNFEGMVNEDILSYLNGQMDKIKKVGEVTNAALKQAEEMLAE